MYHIWLGDKNFIKLEIFTFFCLILILLVYILRARTAFKVNKKCKYRHISYGLWYEKTKICSWVSLYRKKDCHNPNRTFHAITKIWEITVKRIWTVAFFMHTLYSYCTQWTHFWKQDSALHFGFQYFFIF